CSLTPENIPSFLLKKLNFQISPILSRLFNRSLLSSEIPHYWKEAIVAPLFKKGNRLCVKNYRPISLTSSVCKVLEIILKDHIVSHLVDNNLLSEKQFGFVKNKSTTTQLISCLQDWMDAVSSNKQVECVYIDYQKAFDSVNHRFLLAKLTSLG